jgi:hypothetical protein
MGELGPPVQARSLYRHPIRCQSPGCFRNATKASDFRWCYWCDPSIPEETKKSAQRLGGRRGQMTPAEASRLFEGLDPTSAESRTAFRVQLMELLALGRLTSSMYRDMLAGLDGMGKDRDQAKAAGPAAVVVELQRFDGQEPA